MKVAAYCRVSTDKDDQSNSLENQIKFFYEYIKNHPDWELSKIYYDEGASGTSIKKRPEFNNMIEDAENGKVNLIVTKEVSRFARNTVDTLNYTRLLKAKNVGVLFINDNINTLDNDGEFRLSIMASVAQEESRKISARVKWGIMRQMREGFVFSSPMIGYDYNKGVLTVNEEEAEIVKRIFDLYVNHGYGSGKIAEILTSENTPTCKRIKKWSSTLILRILKNEKYVGDLIQQKRITSDYLTHSIVVNEEDKLYFRDHHEPIVARAIWDKAQQIISDKRNNTSADSLGRSNRYWCSGKVRCGICGNTCVTKTKKAIYGTIRIYRCAGHAEHSFCEGNSCCNRSYIDERILLSCMRVVAKNLSPSISIVLKDIRDAYEYSRRRNDSADKLSELYKKINNLEQKKKKLLDLLIEDVISKEDYQRSVAELSCKTSGIKLDIDKITIENSFNKDKAYSEIEISVSSYLKQEIITRDLYKEILDKILIYPENKIDVQIKEEEKPFSVKYSRSGRGTQYVVDCVLQNANIAGEQRNA